MPASRFSFCVAARSISATAIWRSVSAWPNSFPRAEANRYIHLQVLGATLKDRVRISYTGTGPSAPPARIR
jgi:hypothetical protein